MRSGSSSYLQTVRGKFISSLLRDPGATNGLDNLLIMGYNRLKTGLLGGHIILANCWVPQSSSSVSEACDACAGKRFAACAFGGLLLETTMST